MHHLPSTVHPPPFLNLHQQIYKQFYLIIVPHVTAEGGTPSGSWRGYRRRDTTTRVLNEFSQIHILLTQHSTLGIKYKTFLIDQNSDDQSLSAPSDRGFFLPRTVPSLNITSPTHQRQTSYRLNMR